MLGSMIRPDREDAAMFELLLYKIGISSEFADDFATVMFWMSVLLNEMPRALPGVGQMTVIG